ncbi:hypothetical protein B4079_4811 [Bacillus cereus]|nr:hypothetical protein B4079_4811 [Bacillus cereus]
MIESLSNEKANMILQELQVECESLFEFQIQKVIPIHRGWLNLKWKLETNVGTLYESNIIKNDTRSMGR